MYHLEVIGSDLKYPQQDNELSAEKFLPFGSYANYINPQTEKIGAAPIEFFRDMVQQTLGAQLEADAQLRIEGV